VLLHLSYVHCHAPTPLWLCDWWTHREHHGKGFLGVVWVAPLVTCEDLVEWSIFNHWVEWFLDESIVKGCLGSLIMHIISYPSACSVLWIAYLIFFVFIGSLINFCFVIHCITLGVWQKSYFLLFALWKYSNFSCVHMEQVNLFHLKYGCYARMTWTFFPWVVFSLLKA
jgi:hypothetical protein